MCQKDPRATSLCSRDAGSVFVVRSHTLYLAFHVWIKIVFQLRWANPVAPVNAHFTKSNSIDIVILDEFADSGSFWIVDVGSTDAIQLAIHNSPNAVGFVFWKQTNPWDGGVLYTCLKCIVFCIENSAIET